MYTGRPRPTPAVAETNCLIPPRTISALSVSDMPRAKYMGNLDVESDTDSEISGAGRARNISPTRAGDSRSHQTAHPPAVILQARRLRIAQDFREYQKRRNNLGYQM